MKESFVAKFFELLPLYNAFLNFCGALFFVFFNFELVFSNKLLPLLATIYNQLLAR